MKYTKHLMGYYFTASLQTARSTISTYLLLLNLSIFLVQFKMKNNLPIFFRCIKLQIILVLPPSGLPKMSHWCQEWWVVQQMFPEILIWHEKMYRKKKQIVKFRQKNHYNYVQRSKDHTCVVSSGKVLWHFCAYFPP